MLALDGSARPQACLGLCAAENIDQRDSEHKKPTSSDDDMTDEALHRSVSRAGKTLSLNYMACLFAVWLVQKCLLHTSHDRCSNCGAFRLSPCKAVSVMAKYVGNQKQIAPSEAADLYH